MNNFLNLFDTWLGLPIHPLVIHGVVVLVPLAGISLAGSILFPRFRSILLPPTILALLASTALSFIAQESGKQLAITVGNPVLHADLGTWVLPAVSSLTAFSLLLWFILEKRQPAWLKQAVSIVGLLAVACVTVLIFLVGHSGAEATWSSRIAASESKNITPSPRFETIEMDGKYSLAEIAQHDSRQDCWTAIEGKVYDLTPYMKQHPGGAGTLAWLCGIDGTKLFANQHGTDQRPANDLSGFEIGVLE